MGAHSKTSYGWCWWLRNSGMLYETDAGWQGTVEADDLYHTAGQKGQRARRWQELVGAPAAWSS